MKTHMTKNEKLFALVVLIAISIFAGLFMHINLKAQSRSGYAQDSLINYEMARPEQSYSEYNLDGRELDQSYEALAKKEKKTATVEEKKKAELVAKSKENAKKDKDNKKKQQAVRAQKPETKAETVAERGAQRQMLERPQLERTSQERPSGEEQNFAGVPSSPAPTPVAEVKNEKEITKKTFAEWRDLLLAAPTTENLGLFVAAFRRNEVTSEEFQVMAQDLISQADIKLKALGLMALRSAPSLASLSQLAHLDAESISGYQSYVQQSLNAYLQPANLSYLNQALQTRDKVLLVKALSLLNTNLVELSEGAFVENRGRGNTVSEFSAGDYSMLMPSLTTLSSSSDQELAAMAQQAASIIQGFGNVAQN